MLQDISYKYYRKKSDIHGTVLYPAVMVAPMQNDILAKLINDSNCNTIFDPFHGSGTSLYESAMLSDKLELTGCDINPLANLITKVKLQGVNNNIYNDIEKLKTYISNDNSTKNHHFKNINKWFSADIIDSLSILHRSIKKISDKQNRLYFWYMLSDIVRKYSNTRSSTYKLHIKPIDSINNVVDNCINDYIYAMINSVEIFKESSRKFCLYKSDILEKIKDFEENSFDISITSPPYGENATTVPYGQFSMLSLYWIDPNDLELDGWELDNYSRIDNASLGGKKRIPDFDVFELSLLNPYLDQISNSKKVKVINFFDDYFFFLKQLCRVTNQYIVMTLGNRTVDGININLTDITKEYLEYNNFINIDLGKRRIPQKRMPYMTSTVNNKPVESINHEYVIIHEKQYPILYDI